MGKEVPAEAIATLTEKVVAKLPTTSQTPPPRKERSQSHHQRAQSPEPNPSQQLMPGVTPASGAIEREKLRSVQCAIRATNNPDLHSE
ncbi:hypothetical protein E2C01_060206 [Portunus trituberculatus]|uniref:Uncharacterized protein n=1 Tax=Portunus trituberculatus TaxID=210409 RepID=A0A5B7H7F2_PORTR|nr:hypothetical protein [Portunus trituberculatus]